MSSLIKPIHPNHAVHIRNEVQSFVFPDHDEELTLAGFCEKLDYSPEDFMDYDLSDHWRPKEDFEDYMNEISESILESFRGPDQDRPILFHNASTIWTEIHSAWENFERDGWAPVTVTRVLIHFTSGYCQCKRVPTMFPSKAFAQTPKLNLKDPEQSQLIYVFVERLYDLLPSMIDPTVKRQKMAREQNSFWVFDIMLTIPNSPSVECVGYRIEKALESVGRRTQIFVNNDNPKFLIGVAISVTTDQYCYRGHRFNEADVLGHVHAEEEIPGVVHLAHSEDMLRSYGTPICSGDRRKKRTCLVEYGKPFMDLKTPLEALKVIYDLLETTRLLYFKRKILHRDLDISSGNLLYMEKDRPTAAALTINTSQQHNFCFIGRLLDPNVAPGATVNLLVDFDRGEIRNKKEDESRLERTGTSIFMARAVRAGRPLGKVGALAWYWKLPELSQKAHLYEDVFPDRMARFQHSPGSSDRPVVDIGALPDSSSLLHELRHDAESAFWLLVWWVVNAAPDGRTSEMPTQLWVLLVGTAVDTRSLDIPSSVLDPAYAPLSELLQQLGEALEHDLHWATDTPYTHPDFLHEVFQRRILNFIFENQDKPFMKLAKADASRKPGKSTMSFSLSTEEADSNRSRSGRSKHSRNSEPESDSGTPKKSKGSRK